MSTNSTTDQAFFFEGPEKRLEIIFSEVPERPNGLLDLRDGFVQPMLEAARCRALNLRLFDSCAMYLLAESSLFVFPFKVMIKTCGSTPLLDAVPALLALLAGPAGRGVAWRVEACVYSRRNFFFPAAQPPIHRDFPGEIAFLNAALRADGDGYILGSLARDHHHIYVADHRAGCEAGLSQVTFEMMMCELPAANMAVYFTPEGTTPKTPEEVTREARLDTILPGSVVDAWVFEPCGYSANALLDGKWYWTIHITPEASHSYVSFETNVPHSVCEYTTLVERVLSCFNPGRFLVSVASHDDVLADASRAISIPRVSACGYRRTALEFTRFAVPFNCAVVGFTRGAAAPASPALPFEGSPLLPVGKGGASFEGKLAALPQETSPVAAACGLSPFRAGSGDPPPPRGREALPNPEPGGLAVDPEPDDACGQPPDDLAAPCGPPAALGSHGVRTGVSPHGLAVRGGATAACVRSEDDGPDFGVSDTASDGERGAAPSGARPNALAPACVGQPAGAALHLPVAALS